MLLATGLLVLTSVAQPTLVAPVDAVESESLDSVMVAEWFVANGTESELTLLVQRNIVQTVENMNLPYVAGSEGAYERFCWGGTCYPYGTASSLNALALTLQPSDTTGLNAFGAEEWLIADYYPNGEAGSTAMEYCFSATQQGVPSVCHTVLFCAGAEPGECVLNVPRVQTASLGALAPNPVVGISGVAYSAPMGAEMHVLDLTGRTLKTIPLAPGEGSVWFNAQEFAPGTYLYALQVEGRIGQVRKFSVSR